MASTTFVDNVTPIVASWLNDVNTAVYTPATLSVAKTSSTGSAVLPTGTTAQRDGTPLTGYLRYNTTTTSFEGYSGGVWGSIGGGATGGTKGTFYEVDPLLDTSYTLQTDKNAITAGNFQVATGQTLTIPSGQGLYVIGLGGSANNSYPALAGNNTWTGIQTFSAGTTFAGTTTWTGLQTFAVQPVITTPQSMVRLTTTGIANGSTNTVVLRFSTQETNQGTDITYADSVTLGSLFTINTNGVYSISLSVGANAHFGITRNVSGSPITTSIMSVATSERLALGIASAAGVYTNICWTGYLTAGSLIRPLADGPSIAAANSSFTITRIA